VIEPENLPPQIVARHDEPFTLDFDHHRPLPEITAEFTRRIEGAYLQRVLEKYRGRIELCAKHCGLSRRSISEKLRRYQIDKRAYKPHTSRRKHYALAGE
jgi:two-component system NtrC family response regulator